MSSPGPDPKSHDTIATGDGGDWLDPALARLAFGSRSAHRAQTGVPSHLAFLSAESLEIDLSDPRQREFGDYELLELIGQGGMGVVYRARQACLDRIVAVKLLSAGPWASALFVERFQHEAQAAARMQHPNIVAIYETGVHEDLNFFSMRLVDGGSLANLLSRRGKLPPVEAARLLRTIAEAVDYAHRLDVLHLDLKPGNVLIDGDGEPHVADFGLARRFDEVLSLDSHEVSGTPSYMSPEQAQAHSRALSPATDIYGLGAILYECLTGRPPFHAATPQETLLRVVTVEASPPRALEPKVPADLDAICLKCLAKDPAARYRSARGLADDLSRFLEGREVVARPLNSGQRVLQLARREPKLTALVALLFFSLVFGFAATSLQWKRAERNAAASSALLWESRREEALRLERAGDGFAALPRLLANIREQDAAGEKAQATLERRRIGMLLGQAPVLVDRMVIADASPLAVALSPDGQWLAVGLSDQSVRWYDAATLTERGRISLRGRLDAMGRPGVPRLLRFVDGHALRVTMDWLGNFANPYDGDTWLVALDHAAVVEPPKEFADFADATYSDDGRFAMLRKHSRQAQLWQVHPWAPRSGLSPATDQFTPWLLGPDARYAAFLDIAMINLRIHHFPELQQTPITALPSSAGISAWARSANGRWLALGDFEGRVYLLNPDGGAPRLLPTPHSREVTWVAFSEDDAWLAVATRDGTAYAFDVASGSPLIAGQMQQDFALERIGISHAQRLLIAAGKGRTALWRLPEQGPRAVSAFRIGANPVAHVQAEDYSVAWSLGSGLLASAGLDGEVRLWRLPLGPTAPGLAARQVPERTWFDGRRLVDVAWNKLRIIAPGGAPLTAWLTLPQPPGFAELIDGGNALVVTVGPELRVYDSRSLHLRHPPITLDASPERLVSNADGSRVVLSFSDNGTAGFEERLQAFDLRAGRRLPGEAKLAAPLRHLAISRDGKRLLAVGPPSGATTVLATTDLRLLGDFPQDESQPVAWADFDRDGSVLMATRAPDVRLGNNLLVHWDPVADRVLSQRETGPAQPVGVIASGTGVFLAGSDQDEFATGDGTLSPLPRLARSDATAALAVSEDGTLVAHAFRREVQLHDARTGIALGPPLPGDSDANDVIVQLAFAPDGSRLLARTVQGHWRSWAVGADTRPTTEIAAQLLESGVGRGGTRGVSVASRANRLAMRRRDPGPWPAGAAAPMVALSRIPSFPPRDRATSPLLVDLGPAYNVGPDDVRNPFYNIRSQMRPIPAGIQRIAGVDYDLRGLVQVGTVPEGKYFDGPANARQDTCLPVPRVPIAAFRLLVQVSTPNPERTGAILAAFRLQFSDGGQVDVPLRAQVEVPGFAGSDEDVPMALAIDAGLVATGYTDAGLANPRLANPFPDRLVRCVRLVKLHSLNPMLLFAITAEPVHATPAAPGEPGPVIAPGSSRTGVRAEAPTARHPPQGNRPPST